MDQLKKQGFWVLLGVILLAEAIFFFVAVFGKGAEIDALEKKVSKARGDLKRMAAKEEIPSEDLKKRYEDIVARYVKEEQAILDQYATLDKDWEPWAESPRPPVDEYAATYNDRVNALVNRFYEAIGPEKKAGEDGAFKREQAIGDDNMELVEKRLIVQTELADIFLKADLANLGGFQFPDSTSYATTRTNEEGEEEGLLAYTVHPVVTQVTVRHTRIPEIISNILKSRKVPFRLKSLSFGKDTVMGEIPPEDDTERYLDGYVFRKNFSASENEAYERMPDDEILPEPSVSLRMTLEVVDIDKVAGQ